MLLGYSAHLETRPVFCKASMNIPSQNAARFSGACAVRARCVSGCCAVVASKWSAAAVCQRNVVSLFVPLLGANFCLINDFDPGSQCGTEAGFTPIWSLQNLATFPSNS